MYFDRFDICDAWYLFLSHHHEGQWSEKYSRLSRLLGFYSPSCLNLDSLSENARAIYNRLVEKEYQTGIWYRISDGQAVQVTGFLAPTEQRHALIKYETLQGAHKTGQTAAKNWDSRWTRNPQLCARRKGTN